MKVLLEKLPIKKCNRCKSKFKYSSKDIYKINDNSSLFQRKYIEFINCPVCDKQLVIGSGCFKNNENKKT